MGEQLPTEFQTFIHLSRYARWRDDVSRRETWSDTVSRYIDFWRNREWSSGTLKNLVCKQLDKAEQAILNLEVMPSMRCMMTAGKALQKDNVAGFNCAYAVIDDPKKFDEIAYILMCGTGIGFSVESRYTEKLPIIAKKLYPSNTTIVIEDSKIGWASGFRELISLLYTGKVPKWDVSKVRKAGERLKTFGGRASGPEPLEELFRFAVSLFQKSAGRRLTSLECHDLVCKIAEIVVVGGVRRSALISLSDLGDARMRGAKTGRWWEAEKQRALANNSAVYNEKPTIGVFLDEWKSLIESLSGERGIINRQALQNQARKTGRRDPNYEFGTNPCSEISLRPDEFCNLTEAVVRADDDLNSLKKKVKIAAFLGTLQSTLTNYRYINDTWKKNCEEERLLGVSLTGILDNQWLVNAKRDELEELKDTVIEENKHWAELLGISQSVATTCVKPSGTVSQLTNSSSGIHPRFSEFYIRTVRADKKDPLAKMMADMGFPVEDDKRSPQSTSIFSFPIKSPKGSVTRKDMGAIDQLKLWLKFQRHWCEHKPSVTIYVQDEEWLDVAAFVYKNFDEMSGVSFLPYDNGIYEQAPYQEITEEKYNEWLKIMPINVDWSKITQYELDDQTTGSKELACAAGSCEI